ncbi:MAG TPA: DUF2336 domain-containing protein [Alphaproteobacteria bacterium]|nr:DUF2336 domain-containing protein [Alphaproteobacteria bacterium]
MSDASYERDKRLAADPDIQVRRGVARSRSARPEILYYLATDSAASVRREIAANERTPAQADLLLVRDPDEAVRADLARKVSALLPNLTADEQSQARERVIEMVSTLARDAAVRVRQVVAETLKDVASAPAGIIRQLAEDIELVVAEPVLRWSPLLTDDDLLEIIGRRPIPGAVAAIAQRAGVSGVVADAIVAADDEAAVAALLANSSAQIREETLDLIVERAPARTSWHPQLVSRPVLPSRLVRRIACFVAATLLHTLEQRADLDPQTRAAVSAEVGRRLNDAPAPSEEQTATAEEIVAKLKAQGALDEDAVFAAMGEGKRAVVKAALAVLSGVGGAAVEKIMSSHSAKGIVALVWKAGLSPRLASQIQLRLGGIPPRQVLSARGGEGWPLSPEDMRWHLEFFGAKL